MIVAKRHHHFLHSWANEGWGLGSTFTIVYNEDSKQHTLFVLFLVSSILSSYSSTSTLHSRWTFTQSLHCSDTVTACVSQCSDCRRLVFTTQSTFLVTQLRLRADLRKLSFFNALSTMMVTTVSGPLCSESDWSKVIQTDQYHYNYYHWYQSFPQHNPHHHMHTQVQALLSRAFLQTLPELVRPLPGHSISLHSCPLVLSVHFPRFGY